MEVEGCGPRSSLLGSTAIMVICNGERAVAWNDNHFDSRRATGIDVQIYSVHDSLEVSLSILL